MTVAPFTLSIEATAGKSFQHGFHLGTQEALARQIAEEKFHARVKHGLPVVTVALKRNGYVVDVFDGKWFNAFYQAEGDADWTETP